MTSNFFNIPHIHFVNDDCFNYINTLTDDSVDLIILDPPYYKYLSTDWDNQWANLEEYLQWLERLFIQCSRILKPQGSLYCFCSNRHTSEIESLLKKYFHFLNHITWKKPSGRYKATNKESLRRYATASERILFAEHYGVENKNQTGYKVNMDKLKGATFAPLIEYFINAKNTLGLTAKDIHKATNTQMYKHWFSFSQWELPTLARYEQLYRFFDDVAVKKGIKNPLNLGYAALSSNYHSVKENYDKLKRQFDNARRYFRVSKEVPYTDVWEFMPVQFYPGKHPCEKPLDMLVDMINASSRPGDVVADFFVGSGSTPIACIKTGRAFIGTELNKDDFKSAVVKIEKHGNN